MLPLAASSSSEGTYTAICVPDILFVSCSLVGVTDTWESTLQTLAPSGDAGSRQRRAVTQGAGGVFTAQRGQWQGCE